MSQSYEVRVHGKGFQIETADGVTRRDFEALRRVKAVGPFEANAAAIATIKKELSEDARFGDLQLQPEEALLLVKECYRVLWLMAAFTKSPGGFVFIEPERPGVSQMQ